MPSRVDTLSAIAKRGASSRFKLSWRQRRRSIRPSSRVSTVAKNLSFYAGLGTSLAKARVPAALLLNESKSLAQIEEAIDLGFNAVMVENEGFELDDYRRMVRQVVRSEYLRHCCSTSPKVWRKSRKPSTSGSMPSWWKMKGSNWTIIAAWCGRLSDLSTCGTAAQRVQKSGANRGSHRPRVQCRHGGK